MKIALIGYGTMGRIIEMLATEKGHEIAAIVDSAYSGSSIDAVAAKLKGADAAIDFSLGEAVRRNVEACVLAGVPLVEGTTGWNAERDSIGKFVRDNDGSMVFGANFSIGVNIFYRVVDLAAGLFAKFPDYEAFIEERHHSRKKDAPSGTALKLKEIVAGHIHDEFTVTSTRAGNIPGTHCVGFDGNADQIVLEHSARSNVGFGLGAITAAEWIIGKKGFYEFPEIMDEILRE